MSGVDLARSLLFVPGDRADRFDKAIGSSADAIVLDLEDSVAPSKKVTARQAVGGWLAAREATSRSDEPAIVVRVNATDTPWQSEDLAMATEARCAVLLPKTQTVGAVRSARSRIPEACPIIGLIETAHGVRQVDALCESGMLSRVAFGSLDLAVDLGVDSALSKAVDYARVMLVLASAAARLPPPIDGVTVAIDDPQRLSADLADAVSTGFGGKLAIHPRQVAPINAAWSPTPEDIEWARRIMVAIDEPGVGVTVVDGQMVDQPVVTRARRLLARTTLTQDGTS